MRQSTRPKIKIIRQRLLNCSNKISAMKKSKLERRLRLVLTKKAPDKH